MLIAARVVQGLGASVMTPQTMAVITRTFPAGRAGGPWPWGATAGVATLVGPILGGVLVDGLGWEWIFFINVPVGVVGLVLAARLVPELPTHAHRFDLLGVVLSAVGMFLLVFGIQEGQTYNWGTIAGPISVWSLIIAGLVVLGGVRRLAGADQGEPLLSLELFRDRNFSLANVAIAAVGFARHRDGVPAMLYAQGVLGLTPDPGGAAARPDGDHLGGCRRRRAAHRPRPPPLGRRRSGSPASSAVAFLAGRRMRPGARSGSCSCRSR